MFARRNQVLAKLPARVALLALALVLPCAQAQTACLIPPTGISFNITLTGTSSGATSGVDAALIYPDPSNVTGYLVSLPLSAPFPITIPGTGTAIEPTTPGPGYTTVISIAADGTVTGTSTLVSGSSVWTWTVTGQVPLVIGGSTNNQTCGSNSGGGTGGGNGGGNNNGSGAYTVTLSNVTDTSPGSTLPLIATVTDSTGAPAPGITVALAVSALNGSGGHQHGDDTDPDRTGLLNGVRQSVTATTLTDANGSYAFTYSSPNVSGTYKISASCVELACQQAAPQNVNVKVNDLVPMPTSSSYVLVGGGSAFPHPDNHYLTKQALLKARELALQWRQMFPSLPVLAYNDASLVWGGTFDLDKDWIPPHAEHAAGVVIDVRANGTATAIPVAYGLPFVLLVYSLGGNLVIESDHYHVRLLGIAK